MRKVEVVTYSEDWKIDFDEEAMGLKRLLVQK